MRVRRTAAVGAAVVLNIFAMGILSASEASATGGVSTAPATVSPAEMGYNSVTLSEMGYNAVSMDEMGYN